MGCSSCSSGDGGTPKGCQNNGTCSSGGCNKLGVFDWLGNMALPAGQTPFDIVEIRFKNSRKAFYRNANNLTLQVGDVVVLDTTSGTDTGVVSIVGELARIQVRKKTQSFNKEEILPILRIANQADIDLWIKAREREIEILPEARKCAINLKLEMKISDVEFQADNSKATFYYTSEERVDFRQLIRDLADKFKARIEMRQIGSRQEAQRLGGIGSCGRELCCSTWLTDFRSVSTSAARYQQLSLNPQKLAGQCGKLKCCLNYELDSYLDGLKSFPSTETKLQTQKGTAVHVKTDVFKRQMWYIYIGEAGGGGIFPLTPEYVKEVIELNKKSEKPSELLAYVEEVEEEELPDYTNVVGQDSLNRFDNSFKKKKKKKPNSNNLRPSASVTGEIINSQQNISQQNTPSQNTTPQNRPQQNRPQGDRPQGDRGPRPVQGASSIESEKPQGNIPPQNRPPNPNQNKPKPIIEGGLNLLDPANQQSFGEGEVAPKKKKKRWKPKNKSNNPNPPSGNE